MYLLWKGLCDFLKLLKFMLFLKRENIFRDGNPELILRVIQKFIELEQNNYINTVVLNRNVVKSSNLLSALIYSYFETKSEVTLNQILEVLKVEFIMRNQNV